jgi:hypothetical protein
MGVKFENQNKTMLNIPGPADYEKTQLSSGPTHLIGTGE